MQESHQLPAENKSYNERLFKKGIRKYFHEARFTWLQHKLKALHLRAASVLELGCYDGKLIRYLPFSPKKYDGYDAGWEDGLTLAQQHWKAFPQYQFHYCNEVADFNPNKETYDITVCMETLEHLPLSELEDYLLRIKASTSQYVFITVPNEKGPLVALKYAIKKMFLKIDEPYSLSELMYASIGHLKKVKRKELGHKGFDYEQLVEVISKHFEVISVEGIPFPKLPRPINFSIGILAKPISH